jgi:hypothetical protein
MPTKETIRCPTCGFQVEHIPNGANATNHIDWAVYTKTCRRAKDQPAFVMACPDLQAVLDKRR